MSFARRNHEKDCFVPGGIMRRCRFHYTECRRYAARAFPVKSVGLLPRRTYYYLGQIYEQLAAQPDMTSRRRELLGKALDAWRQYVNSDHSRELPQSHGQVNRPELIKQAQKHISILSGELANEK
jgi:hypothetical protein